MHSPSVAANKTTEQLTCVFTDHMSVACGGGVGGGANNACCSSGKGPTIGNHYHNRSITPNVLLYICLYVIQYDEGTMLMMSLCTLYPPR